MKACIYQKQEPVNIPQIETGVLTDVLRLPWGVEIYGLLTRWNPLQRPAAVPAAVQRDERARRRPGAGRLHARAPPPERGVRRRRRRRAQDRAAARGVDRRSRPRTSRPGRSATGTRSTGALDERMLVGFGGVSEYGITVRWDKNFLTLLHLTLARRDKFRVFGGVRFGGTLTLEDAWELGFDHVAIAAGAGKPTIIDMKNNLVRGIRKASDFLMALQLTGASKKDSLANLQVRLPAVVIGGGLTGDRHRDRAGGLLPAAGREDCSSGSRSWRRPGGEGQVPREPRRRGARDSGRVPRARPRGPRRSARAPRRRARSPTSRRWSAPGAASRSPTARADRIARLPPEPRGGDQGPRGGRSPSSSASTPMRRSSTNTAPCARCAFAARSSGRQGDRSGESGAAGAQPHASPRARRRTPSTRRSTRGPSSWTRAGSSSARTRPGAAPTGSASCRPTRPRTRFFTSYDRDGRLISFYGDNHPVYAGNVVKAMASAKHGYRQVAGLFAERDRASIPRDTQSERESGSVASRPNSTTS